MKKKQGGSASPDLADSRQALKDLEVHMREATMLLERAKGRREWPELLELLVGPEYLTQGRS